MKRHIASFVFALLAAAAPAPASAQLAAPNADGVAMGHVHLFAKDVEVMRRFLVALGGTPTANGTLQMVRFPGTFINLGQRDMSTGGSIGSVVNHFGFHVKSVPETLTKIAPFGLKVDQNNPQQAFILGPDDVRVELLQDDALPMPVRLHHVHLFVPDPVAAQAWYVKHFGATAGKRGNFLNANVPGVEISFTMEPTAQAPSEGRTLDHIGFEVSNRDAFLTRLASLGLNTTEPPRIGSNGTTKIAYVQDPWGTRIEITEGIAPKP